MSRLIAACKNNPPEFFLCFEPFVVRAMQTNGNHVQLIIAWLEDIALYSRGQTVDFIGASCPSVSSLRAFEK